MATEKNLRELFHDTLKDIYFAEKKILSALPKMAKAAASEDLKAAFEKHETETEEHVARLEKGIRGARRCAAWQDLRGDHGDHRGRPNLMPDYSRRPRQWSITRSPGMAP